MPRRKTPLLPRAEADRSDAEALRPALSKAILSHEDTRHLNAEKADTLTDALVNAIGFAKAGLSVILAGKRARPDAWTMDIFVMDVRNALARVGISTTANPDPEMSRAQKLAREIARLAGLPDQGTLYTQLQRAQKIERQRHPDCSISIAVVQNLACGDLARDNEDCHVERADLGAARPDVPLH